MPNGAELERRVEGVPQSSSLNEGEEQTGIADLEAQATTARLAELQENIARLQSVKDREIAQERQRNQALAAQLKALENALERMQTEYLPEDEQLKARVQRLESERDGLLRQQRETDEGQRLRDLVDAAVETAEELGFSRAEMERLPGWGQDLGQFLRSARAEAKARKQRQVEEQRKAERETKAQAEGFKRVDTSAPSGPPRKWTRERIAEVQRTGEWPKYRDEIEQAWLRGDIQP